MNAPFLAVLALALPALACCGTCEQRPPPSAAAPPASGGPGVGKLEAPVEIDARLGERTARISLRFGSPAAAVRVDVSGVDGLVVAGSPTLVDGASYDRGAEAAFDVTFTPGPGLSHLVVVVSGAFGGAHLAKVRTVAVGAPAPATPAEERTNGRLLETPGGDRVKLVPGR